MPDEMTAAEREFCARTGQDPADYLAIRDAPQGFGGGRSLEAVAAALRAAREAKEADGDD